MAARISVALAGVVAIAGCQGDSERDPLPGLVSSSGATGNDSGEDEDTATETTPGTTPDHGDGETTGDDGEQTTGDEGGTPHVVTLGRTPGLVEEADGSWTYDQSTVFLEVGKAFYAEHPDDYDFLAVYTEGSIPYHWAQALPVKQDIGGIGFDDEGEPWIVPSDAGSAGRLRQINIMNIPDQYGPAPSDASVLVHETAHHWAAYLELDGTPTPGYLLDGDYGGHWNIHVETGGPSAVGYGELSDLGGGRFQFTSVWPLQMSALELYLAGLMPPEEVPPLFYVQSPTNYDPATSYEGAWTHTAYGEDASFDGTRVDFTIDDVIARNGPRIPAFGEAPTHFRFAFILVCNDAAACPPEQLAIVEAQRVAFVNAFATATGGRATVDTDL